ncbi:tetratricopeptide repeat protein [Arhodomonas aquaeolei]|uniref:tetratricopeptide repeat protein n=1 Tax=Arhodomonas aquaeolei TaxID=2369 RepID=UPI002167DFD8|nr:tetratricopeptide repeat protein [Arhodomonas aquaeolei]MCS4504109.1 tetratricopeptide repeat protein [Arhodomonas aquaeolei]
MPRFIFLVALAAVIAGCATNREAAEPGPSPVAEDAAASDPHQELIYQLLVGEFAGNRGAFDQAAQAYGDAMALTDDPAVAQRAARVALYAERFDLARTAARRWLALAPAAREPHRILAVVALREGDPEAATESFLAYLPGDGDTRDQALSRLGAALAQEGDANAAMAVARGLAGHFPESAAAQLMAARVALSTGRARLALQSARAALQLRPGWRAAALVEVEALRRSGRAGEALKRLDGMVADSPGDYELRLEYARALAAAGRSGDALGQFHALLERQPDDDRILLSGALLALQSGHHDQARRWLKRLLAIETRTDAANYYLGRLALDEGDAGQAVEYLRRAGGEYAMDAALAEATALAADGRIDAARQRLRTLRDDNSDAAVQAYATEAELLRRSGRQAEALSVLDEALQAHPGDADLRYARAMARIQAGSLEQAITDLEAVIDADPQNAAALNALGYTLADGNRDLDRAASLVSRAYQLSPDDPAVVDSMGWVAYRQGRLEQALDYLRRAESLSGGDPEIAAHLGEVLWQLGRKDEARRVWREALEAYPDHEVLRSTVERFQP